MPRINEEVLTNCLVGLIVENEQVRAAAAPVYVPPALEVDELGERYDQALDEINQYRVNEGREKIEPPAEFKQKVIDTFLRRMEAQGRVHYLA